MPNHQPPEPWHSFLAELDSAVSEEVDFQCLGGFVVTQLYGLQRPTADVDVLSIAPIEQLKPLIEKGGKNSELHQKHKIYLDYVGVVSVPYDYDTRLIEMYPGTYRRLRLFALEAHDLALTKLSRNIARDREDVRYLARTIPLDLQLLQERYRTEFQPYAIGNRENLDDILRLWLEMIEEDRSSGR
jgi:hypothetical protein